MKRMMRWILGIVLGALLATVLAVPVMGQPYSAQVQQAVNNLTNGITPFNYVGMAASAYINWGTARGSSGYGIRSNAGVIEGKNSGGSWVAIAPTGGSAPVGAQYWTGAADSTLTAEKNLGALSTALVVNTAGVPSAYAGVTCTNQFLRVLSAIGGGTCATVTSSDVDSTVVPGAWTTPSYSAGNFTANGAMTWTVAAGDVTTYAYSNLGKTMTVALYLSTTDIGGTPDTTLSVAIPNSKVSTKAVGFPCWFHDNGTPSIGKAEIPASGTTIGLQKIDQSNWTATTGGMRVRCVLTFEVN